MTFDSVSFFAVFTWTQVVVLFLIGTITGIVIPRLGPNDIITLARATLLGLVFFTSALVDSVTASGPYERVLARVLLWLLFCMFVAVPMILIKRRD